ncbi:MAG: polymorphic toxin type 15 domain-containing protein [Actinomycetaceae bacterium]|nr:polymorphic toxin type 15 domain-containing protein [Actinomycetaceae bacterium]
MNTLKDVAIHGFRPIEIQSIPALLWRSSSESTQAWPAEPIQLPYAIGDTPNTQEKVEHYCEQLNDQFSALRDIPAKVYLQRRDEFRDGKTPNLNARHRAARDEIKDLLVDQLHEDGYSLREAEQLAHIYLSSQAVLHNPDREFGGSPDFAVTPDGLAKLGDRYVNSSIGRQHRDNLAITDHAAEIAVDQGYGDLPLNIDLTLTHNGAHRSLMRAQSPAISGQVSDALHHDPPSIPAEQALTAFLTHTQEAPPRGPKKPFPPPAPMPRRTPADVQASIRSHLTKLQGARQRPQGMSPPGPQQRHKGLGR